MKFASYILPSGEASYGKISGDTVVDLGQMADAPADLKAALAFGKLSHLPEGETLSVSDVHLQPVIPNPDKILCVGLNYETHRKETGRAAADHPAIFTRFADTLIAHGQPLVMPKVSTDFDYEGELAIIIGKGGRNITADKALDHIAGYSCFNDASVRDYQKHNIQFTPGKNFPGTGAFGPYMVTEDEIGDLGAQQVVTKLNGEIVQNQPISDMIWSVPEIVAYISIFTPLAPGDVIATGTPGGVGAKRTPPLWMKPGDKVEVSIGSVGLLSNRIMEEL